MSATDSEQIPNDSRATESPRAVRYLMTTVGIIAALLVAYFIAYLALLGGKVYYPVGTDPVTGINRFRIEPEFRIDGELTEAVFAPALRIDRRIRTEYWKTIENSDGRSWKNPPVSD